MYATDLADGGKIAPIVKQQLEAVGLQGRAERRRHRHLQLAGDHERQPRQVRHVVRRRRQRGPQPVALRRSTSSAATQDPSRRPVAATTTATSATCSRRRGPRWIPTAQDETYHEIAKILNEDVPQLYLWQLAGVHAVNKRVQGIEVPSFERYVTIDASNWSVTS